MYDMDKLQLLNLANQYGQVRTYHSHNLHCQTFIIDSPLNDQIRNCTSSSNQVIDMKYKFGGLAGEYLLYIFCL